MSRLHLRAPSPALAVSLVALFAALGGGAYAATSSDTKQDKKIANKAAKSYFNGHISAASVSHASTAGTANSATNAGHATSADSATNATNATNLGGIAAANYQGKLPWALINSDGTILAQSGGISLVGTFTGGSVYVGFPVHLSAVTVAGAYTATDPGGRGTPIAELCGGGTGLIACTQGPNNTTEAFVRTFNSDNSTPADHPFMIVGIPS